MKNATDLSVLETQNCEECSFYIRIPLPSITSRTHAEYD